MTDLSKEEREAFKAFKKKIKSQQLDDDSRLGRSPLSSGSNQIVAITPPSGHGREIWNELVRKGYLQHDGSLYALAPGQH